MSRRTRRLLIGAGLLVGAYFLVPVLLLKFAFDRFLFPAADGGTTHETRRLEVPLDAGRSILIREYGVAASLGTAVEAAARRRVATTPWAWLPLRSLLQEDFELRSLAQALRPTPIVVFQATEDEVTPFEETRRALLGLDNVQVFPVTQATHSDAYLRSMPGYSAALKALAGL